MRAFARLFTALDETTRTSEKVAAMTDYFTRAAPADAAWAVHFLSGGRPKRLIGARRLAEWAMAESGVRDWLFEECYHTVGDLAEAIALLLPAARPHDDRPLHEWVERRLLPLAGEPEDAQRDAVVRAWRELDGAERFVWNKLITGGFRVGVSSQLVVRALAATAGIDEATMAHRLSGAWAPSAEAYAALLARETHDADPSRPYPFFLAHALDDGPEALGDPAEWQVEWKWDGIRAQLIRRGGRTWIWSRGEELVTDRYPELAAAAELLPDGTVLDGEIMPWRDGRPLGFAQLQRRIGRRTLGPTILAEVPVALIAYDLLEAEREDIRGLPQSERRRRLEATLESSGDGAARNRLILSPLASPLGARAGWELVRAAHGEARERCAEGLMLKRRDAAYGVGRRRGPWWKWKVAPYAVDAVMIYAQAGHGRRAALHTDYTFAVWSGGELVPFAKAYSGLTDAEIRRLDAWIRRNTLERFGPVRRVRPEQVFELAFEGIQPSPRHKAGIAVRFPRILRWRADKRAEDADSLDTLRAFLSTPRADAVG